MTAAPTVSPPTTRAPSRPATPAARTLATQPAVESVPQAAVRPGGQPRLPLERRPRRAKVTRPPSQRAASRALRRTATPTTGRTWLQSRLPEPVRAKAGVPVSESVSSCTAAALLFVPLGLFVGAGPALVAGAVVVGLLAYVLWARRVVVGDTYVAVRQLGRYHVASVDHVKHLQLKPTQRGGVLCVHTDDGRCMRLRRVELTDPQVNAALRALWTRAGGTHDEQVAALLGLPHEERRIRHRYLADAVQ
jgi:hypothetical protein